MGKKKRLGPHWAVPVWSSRNGNNKGKRISKYDKRSREPKFRKEQELRNISIDKRAGFFFFKKSNKGGRFQNNKRRKCQRLSRHSKWSWKGIKKEYKVDNDITKSSTIELVWYQERQRQRNSFIRSKKKTTLIWPSHLLSSNGPGCTLSRHTLWNRRPIKTFSVFSHRIGCWTGLGE